MNSQTSLLLGLLLLSNGGLPSEAKARSVTVDAGEFERHQAVVLFSLPADEKATQLRATDGTTIPLQIEPGGKASFILPRLAKGKRVTYVLTTAAGEDRDA